MLVRRPDWRMRFARFVAQNRETAFVWGQTDCCLQIASAVHAMTNVDVAAELRGRYSTGPGAVRALYRLGFGGVAALVASALQPATRLRVGDVVLLSDPPLDTIFIAAGDGAVWAQDLHGLVRYPVPPGATFWSVGR